MSDTNLADKSARIELRVSPSEKRLIEKAAVLAHTDVTGFIRQLVLPVAEDAVTTAQQHRLSAEDGQLMLDLLENPPAPTPALVAAARAKYAAK